ncbi:hypothetical protein EXS62_02130 [Candidatus Kaiserbacteria bacterium]|nr:hypothetical protein [Candidatus Kaiserbacteria bacterium]
MKTLNFVLGMLVGFVVAVGIWIIKPDSTQMVAKADCGIKINTHALPEIPYGRYTVVRATPAYDTTYGDPIYVVEAEKESVFDLKIYRVERKTFSYPDQDRLMQANSKSGVQMIISADKFAGTRGVVFN